MKNYKIILKALVGSQSYGTATPASDFDHKGIYVQHPNEILGFNYQEQLNVTKDECYYEIRRFLDLARDANPNILELLFTAPECIIEKDPVFDIVLKQRNKFITTKALHSFSGYTYAQIKKADSLNKKMNWENNRIERKTPLDFIYVYGSGKTYLIEYWLKANSKVQELCGLAKLDHMRDCYTLYYDYLGIEKYKGIVGENSNDIRLSEVPKNAIAETVIFYNENAYSVHCREYKEYCEWLKNRNVARYVDVANHNQKIDGKNLMHCVRLLDMAKEIASEGKILVKRPNADYLLSIRRGDLSLTTIIEKAKEDIENLKPLFANSGLPRSIDGDFVNDLLLEVRENVKF